MILPRDLSIRQQRAAENHADAKQIASVFNGYPGILKAMTSADVRLLRSCTTGTAAGKIAEVLSVME